MRDLKETVSHTSKARQLRETNGKAEGSNPAQTNKQLLLQNVRIVGDIDRLKPGDLMQLPKT